MRFDSGAEEWIGAYIVYASAELDCTYHLDGCRELSRCSSLS